MLLFFCHFFTLWFLYSFVVDLLYFGFCCYSLYFFFSPSLLPTIFVVLFSDCIGIFSTICFTFLPPINSSPRECIRPLFIFFVHLLLFVVYRFSLFFPSLCCGALVFVRSFIVQFIECTNTDRMCMCESLNCILLLCYRHNIWHVTSSICLDEWLDYFPPLPHDWRIQTSWMMLTFVLMLTFVVLVDDFVYVAIDIVGFSWKTENDKYIAKCSSNNMPLKRFDLWWSIKIAQANPFLLSYSDMHINY